MFNNRSRPAAKQHGTEGSRIADKINSTALTLFVAGDTLPEPIKAGRVCRLSSIGSWWIGIKTGTKCIKTFAHSFRATIAINDMRPEPTNQKVTMGTGAQGILGPIYRPADKTLAVLSRFKIALKTRE